MEFPTAPNALTFVLGCFWKGEGLRKVTDYNDDSDNKFNGGDDDHADDDDDDVITL